MKRCTWAKGFDLYLEYHDTEWGLPCSDDGRLFEMLILEGAQAGLSWSTILKKRMTYRTAYRDFVVEKVARFGKRDRERLLRDAGIVRNRLKIEASIGNARSFLAVQDEYGSFAKYIWGFVGGEPIQNRWKTLRSVPAETAESVAMSKALKKRGFRFVGPTICYAFMQATGMVNDHTLGCYRHAELAARC